MFSFEDNVGFLTGGCNLERLVWFFMGYIYAVSKAEGKPVDFFIDFGRYAMDHMGVRGGRGLGWQYYLEQSTNSPTEAVLEFYRLFHLYHDEVLNDDKPDG